MKNLYTNERNAQILISLMKAHNVKKVIASPGATNICFVASIQNDPFFEIYSAVDERSAAYMACGLAAESGEPVALSCTGATASRNYMPALTEAYYRKLPILTITSSRRSYRIGHNFDQVTDRLNPPSDVAKISVLMPMVYDDESEWACNIAANKALLELNHRGKGPVHINLETMYSRIYDIEELPEERAIYRFCKDDVVPAIDARKIAIVVGAHLEWSSELTDAVNKFCEKHNAVVICDHTSNYKGKYRVLSALAAVQLDCTSVMRNVDLVIHIGDISGSNFRISSTNVWRVNPDGEIRDTFGKLQYVFEFDELEFFKLYADKDSKFEFEEKFIDVCNAEQKDIKANVDKCIDKLPFSNAWIASQTASNLPENAVLHLGILNTLRVWSYFETPNSVLGYSNVGGFGIDGSISSTIGAALVNKEKLYYCVLGDLAFFYDLNSLGNRHISNNLRILLVNNGKGAEFRLSANPGSLFGENTDEFIAAARHFGNKSPRLVKNYAEELGFEYLSASTKEDYLNILSHFLSPTLNEKPIVLEVFTESENENKALDILKSIMTSRTGSISRATKRVVRDIVGEKGVQTIKNILKNK